MFQDDASQQAVYWESSWKTIRAQSSAAVQTSEVLTNEAETQSRHLVDSACQCETQEDVVLSPEYVEDTVALHEFLVRVEPKVSACLNENLTSHAFDGYEVIWEELYDSVQCVHTLTDPTIDQLQCTDVSWSASGAMLVASYPLLFEVQLNSFLNITHHSYGRHDHENWCPHKGLLCMWNLSSGKLSTNKADNSIDVESCVMCVACHPHEVAVLAGGTFAGEVKVWYLTADSKWLVISSALEVGAHKEPVTKVKWLSFLKSSCSYQLISLAGDGCIILWKVNMQSRKMEITQQFALPAVSGRAKGVGNCGGTCLAFPYQDKNTFIVGCETGSLLKCSLRGGNTGAWTQSPVIFSFQSHHGPVYDVQCSPYHRNLFLSCGTDSACHLHSLLESQPLLSLTPSCGYLFSASWSPSRPCVFALASQHGRVLIYDLMENKVNPVVELPSKGKKSPVVFCVEFNQSRPHLLASGDEQGKVNIWHVSSKLKTQQLHEQETLDTIMEHLAT